MTIALRPLNRRRSFVGDRETSGRLSPPGGQRREVSARRVAVRPELGKSTRPGQGQEGRRLQGSKETNSRTSKIVKIKYSA